MEATGVFSSCVTALMKASCCSFRRISRTRNVVFSTTPLMMVKAKIVARKSRIPVRQLSKTHPMYRRIMTEIRPMPSAMKNAMDLRRPATTILSAYTSPGQLIEGGDFSGTRAPREDEGVRPTNSALRGFALGHYTIYFCDSNRFREAEEFQYLDGNPGN